MSIDPISLTAPSIQPLGKDLQPSVQNAAESLGDSFGRMFQEVNNLQQEANAKQVEFATSPDKDIHGTMIASQKADVALRLLMQVRSKLTAAYQEIMRMQV